MNESNRTMVVGSRLPHAKGLITMALALIVLVGLSSLLAPSSLTPGVISTMLPFAAILAIVGLGQMLVVQQAGFDMSLPGSVSLAVVLVAYISYGDSSRLGMALLAVLGAAVAAGLLNALLVGGFGLSPIIATLGTNALLFGVILGVSGGIPRSSTGPLAAVARGNALGIPNTVLIAILVLAVTALALKKTIPGRHFESVGASVRAARVMGLHTRLHIGAAYVGAQLLYAIAGVLLAGIVAQPTAYMGATYLLPSVAVVVLAGTSLRGGRGYPVATVAAALLLTQLDQFTLSLGVSSAAQTLVQAVAFAAGVAIYTINWSRVGAMIRFRGAAPQ
jgi:ribose transport system permease protein